MNDHSGPNPGDPNQDDLNPSEGRHHRQPDGSEPMETGVLPEDFGQGLERLKEASGLSWRGLARALGVDPKRLGQWRKGVEPCGGAMHSLHRFGSRMPGGREILMGEDYQMSFFQDEDDQGEEMNVEEDRKEDEEEDADVEENHEEDPDD